MAVPTRHVAHFSPLENLVTVDEVLQDLVIGESLESGIGSPRSFSESCDTFRIELQFSYSSIGYLKGMARGLRQQCTNNPQLSSGDCTTSRLVLAARCLKPCIFSMRLEIKRMCPLHDTRLAVQGRPAIMTPHTKTRIRYGTVYRWRSMIHAPRKDVLM